MTASPRDASDLVRAGALGLRKLIAAGQLTAEELTRACLARIAEREGEVQAWTFLDPEYALAQARERDAERRAGKPQGPLFGLPVGIKDILDTADMPTENGTVLMAGRRPREDSAAVARLRDAGAVILGKTVTTELAVYHPGKTRNPHDPTRTPGGSSSGSAAAVADFMVPLAVGTQTNGSMIRPAAFCGTVGYKPSHGLISRAGALRQSRRLDQIGVFARSLEDAALLAETLIGFDPADPDTRPRARPELGSVLASPWPLEPEFAFVKTPVWDQAEPATMAAFEELTEVLGDRVEEVPLPDGFAEAHATHATIMSTDIAHNFAPLWQRGRERLSVRLQEIIEAGRATSGIDYLAAGDRREALRAAIEPLFDRFDALITPSAAGPAPKGLEATGSPIFCTIWTLLGLPAVNLPILRGADGMPLGVQVVGRWGDDARLLRHGKWLVQRLSREG